MAMVDLTVETVGEIVLARLNGEIDMSNAGEIGETLTRAVVNEALGLVIDLSEVDYLDSAAIQVIFELRERLQVRGQRIRLVIASDSPIAETLRVADVPAAVGADETPEAALQSMAG